MNQFYPQQGLHYPPTRGPETDYEEYDDYDYDYEEEYDEPVGDTLTQRLLLFSTGGCLVFICMGCCLLSFVGLWILDPGSSLVAPSIPESDVGLTFDQPAFPDEPVVNEENVQLTILEVNRNVTLPEFTPVEGRELIVITIELVNLGEEDVSYSENDFILINESEAAYTISPAASVVDGALGRGKLGANEGLEARLTFDVIAGEANLVLGWESSGASARYIYTE